MASKRFNTTKWLYNELKKNFDFRYYKPRDVMQYRKKGKKDFVFFSERDFNTIEVGFKMNGHKISSKDLNQLINSKFWPVYDPYTDYVKNLPAWDGKTDYIDQLASTVQTTNDKYFRWIFKKWIVAMLAAWIDDEVVNHIVLILYGPPGIGKTRWFDSIVPIKLKDYYSCGTLNLSDKDTQVKLIENVMHCLDEVKNLNEKSIEIIKEMVTKPSINVRRAYRRDAETSPHRCSFCGTTNYRGILHDGSGNRRFSCHEVLSIDPSFDKGILDNVYAQAYSLYKSGEFRYWIEGDEISKVEMMNESFRAYSSDEEVVLSYLSPCDKSDANAKWDQTQQIAELLKKISKNPFKISPEALGRILEKHKFGRDKRNGVYKRCYKLTPAALKELSQLNK